MLKFIVSGLVSAHITLFRFVAFGAGVYAGLYISQNYQVPKVDEPQELWRKIKELTEPYRKPPGS